jgi:hypothetical protein
MKFKITLLMAFVTLFSNLAFAVDHVTLTDGKVLDGQVLTEVPDQYVDFQLTNGEKYRIPHERISKIDRDGAVSTQATQATPTPSSPSASLSSNDGFIYIGALGGVSMNTTLSKSIAPSFGARVGINLISLGVAKIAIGAEYLYTSDSSSYYGGGSLVTNEILGQILVRRLAGTGLYVGGEGGGSSSTQNYSAALVGLPSVSSGEVGGVIGYEFALSSSFDLGIELKEDVQLSTNSLTTSYISKGLVSLTFEL